MIKRALLFFGLIVFSLGVVSATPVTSAAACNRYLLTFPAWYNGSVSDGQCNIKPPKGGSGGLSSFIWAIALNILQAILQLVAYVSAGFIIYGGFLYITSATNADKATSARKTIINASVGLILSFMSVAIVAIVAGNIK